MPKILLYRLFGLLILILSIFSSQKALAKIVINEILPHPLSKQDWVELYNTEVKEVDISNWKLEDSTSQRDPFPEGTKISSESPYLQIFWPNRLDNGGDTLKLKDDQNVIVDQKDYTEDPGIDKSIGRYPDGADNWGILLSNSPNAANKELILPSPTLLKSSPTPTLKPAVKSTSSPSPSLTAVVAKSSSINKTSVPTRIVLPDDKEKSPLSSGVAVLEKTAEGEIWEGIKPFNTSEENRVLSASASWGKPSLFLLCFLLGSGFALIVAAVVFSLKKIKSQDRV